MTDLSRSSRPRRALLGAAALLVLTTAAVTARDRSVSIADFEFSPGSVTVNVGDTVRWTNSDEQAHNAAANDGSFRIGLLGTGESGSFRFTKPGRYAYICEPHPFMQGVVVVKAAAPTDPPAPTDNGNSGGNGNGNGNGNGGQGRGGAEPTLPASTTVVPVGPSTPDGAVPGALLIVLIAAFVGLLITRRRLARR